MGRSKATGPDATTGWPSPPMRHRAPAGTQQTHARAQARLPRPPPRHLLPRCLSPKRPKAAAHASLPLIPPCPKTNPATAAPDALTCRQTLPYRRKGPGQQAPLWSDSRH
jgi:hypothetical protein